MGHEDPGKEPGDIPPPPPPPPAPRARNRGPNCDPTPPKGGVGGRFGGDGTAVTTAATNGLEEDGVGAITKGGEFTVSKELNVSC